MFKLIFLFFLISYCIILKKTCNNLLYIIIHSVFCSGFTECKFSVIQGINKYLVLFGGVIVN